MFEQLDVQRVGSDTVVRFRVKALTATCAEAVAGELLRLAEQPRLRLDFGGLEYLAAAGLGVLLRLRKAMQAAGGRLTLENLDPFLAEIFAVTRLDRVFDVRVVSARELLLVPPAGLRLPGEPALAYPQARI